MRKKEETMEVVMLCVPTEMLREAGIREESVLEMYVEENAVILRGGNDFADFVCDKDCTGCPLSCGGCENKETKETMERGA